MDVAYELLQIQQLQVVVVTYECRVKDCRANRLKEVY